MLTGNIQTAPKRLYLTGVKGLDIILGIATGLILQWFVSYGSCMGLYHLIILYYHIPKPPSLWYCVPACVIALLPAPLVWSRLRSICGMFAKSLLWTCFTFGSLLLWLSYMMAIDNGPSILAR